jgi:hypothetical protein
MASIFNRSGDEGGRRDLRDRDLLLKQGEAARDRLLEIGEIPSDEASGQTISLKDHPGRPAIREDVLLSEYIELLSRRHFGEGVIGMGEERPPPSAVTLLPGQLALEWDALDGSRPYRHGTLGWAVIQTAYRVTMRQLLRQTAGAIVTADGSSVGWTPRSGQVLVTERWIARGRVRQRVSTLSHGDIVLGDPTVMAVVGARGDRFKAMVEAVDLQGRKDVFVYNEAGAPKTLAMLRSELGVLISLTPSKPWDAAGLVPIQLAGGVITDHELNRRNILEELEGGLPPEERTIPPYIAATSMEHARRASEFLTSVRAGS